MTLYSIYQAKWDINPLMLQVYIAESSMWSSLSKKEQLTMEISIIGLSKEGIFKTGQEK
jgi:hypothetical protein